VGVQLGGGSKSKGAASPDINITPLVDVVLVLLIIFMVVTPAINEGAQIELPKVETPDPKAKYMNPIEVTVAPDGTTVCEKKTIKLAQLKGELTALHAKEPERALMLKSDQAMKWGKMRSTFFDLQDIGFKGILLKVSEKKKPGAQGGDGA
jgi:biopolymer transport protein TolR